MRREKDKHTSFSFKTLDDLTMACRDLNITLPVSNNISLLFQDLDIGKVNIPNRLLVQPMEGFDALPDGSPSEDTMERYLNYAKGGAGTIWFEAVAVSEDGKSNPMQLHIKQDNKNSFKHLIQEIRAVRAANKSLDQNPFIVLQLTHSGRYSKPQGKALNKIFAHNKYLDRDTISTYYTDIDLKKIAEDYVHAAELAYEAGFDGVDVKACHGYLLHELLYAFQKESSVYGGPCIKDRAKLLLDIHEEISNNIPDLLLCPRISFFDSIPYPYGFGSDKDGQPDLSEVEYLLEQLIARKSVMINATMGIPYFNPNVNRPFDKPAMGGKLPDEDPLYGVSRLLELCACMQKVFPATPMVATGFSWLRQFFPYVAAGVLENNMAGLVGLGRMSFAYPDFPHDLYDHGCIDPKKTCVTCSACTSLMRNMKSTGCVIRGKDSLKMAFRTIKKGS